MAKPPHTAILWLTIQFVEPVTTTRHSPEGDIVAPMSPET
jgi:hypothetical protein